MLRRPLRDGAADLSDVTGYQKRGLARKGMLRRPFCGGTAELGDMTGFSKTWPRLKRNASTILLLLNSRPWRRDWVFENVASLREGVLRRPFCDGKPRLGNVTCFLLNRHRHQPHRPCSNGRGFRITFGPLATNPCPSSVEL